MLLIHSRQIVEADRRERCVTVNLFRERAELWWLRKRLREALCRRAKTSIIYSPESDDRVEAADLYRKLEEAVLPLYYGRPTAFTELRRFDDRPERLLLQHRAVVGQYAYRVYRTATRVPLGS